jgi:hypothetical protein
MISIGITVLILLGVIVILLKQMIDIQKTMKSVEIQISEVKYGITRNNICVEKLWQERQAPVVKKGPTEAQKKYWERKKANT